MASSFGMGRVLDHFDRRCVQMVEGKGSDQPSFLCSVSACALSFERSTRLKGGSRRGSREARRLCSSRASPTLRAMTTVLLVVLVLCVLYLGLRVHQLGSAVSTLARIVEKPRRRDRAIRREIHELETDLEMIRDLVSQGAAKPEDFEEADQIREKLDRRLRALTREGRKPPSTTQTP